MTEEKKEYEEIKPNEWKPTQDGESIEGVYITKILSNETSNRYYLEDAGNRVMFWGSTVLDERMALINTGSYVRITYKGLKELDKGRMLKLFKVEVAK